MEIQKPNLKRFVIKMGASFITHMMRNQKNFEKFLVKQLDEMMKKSDPTNLLYDFEHDVNLVTKIDPEWVKQIEDIVEENKLDLSELQAKIRTYIPSFDKTWVMNWLYEKHPEFYDTIVLHSRKNEFQSWLASQIRNVTEFTIEHFK